MSQGLPQLRAAPRAQLAPPAKAAPQAVADPGRRQVPAREKAAIIVRLLLAEGAPLPLAALPEGMQAALAEQIGQMRLVDRATLDAVVAEFLNALDGVGLAFPGGIEGALSMMDGHISPSAASRLRHIAAASSKADPWDRIAAQPADRLVPVLAAESVEVAAVALSKLPVARAAEILAAMPGDRARRVAYVMSMTGGTDPGTVRRIGLSLAALFDAQAPRAFDAAPVERMGAILNVTSAQTRETVLAGLDAEDAGFADQVRRAIFTFAHLPARLAPRDVPKVLRLVDTARLVTALAGAEGKPGLAEAAEFLLANISGRMAQGLREEIAQRGRVRDKDAEEAMAAVVTALRQLQAAGEIVLVEPEG